MSRKRRSQSIDVFWVIKDLTFDVAQGETIGIIGANGAGKSTILKLVAGIIIPTEGTVNVSGRVSSLLELGAGFHPDLTGRENIFLYGSLLGLTRATMRRRFDDIVDFSELDEFIDLPVKTYSSGMYLRLAFSVAIHVDPEVLLIDEILAVGDEAFRAKCLERISDLQSAGVTILFISHDLGQVQRLCGRAIWLDGGRARVEGPAEMVIQRYLDAVAQKHDNLLAKRNREALDNEENQSRRWGSKEIALTQVRMLDSTGNERYVFVTDESVTIQICYHATTRVVNPVFGLALHRRDGLHIAGPNTQFANLEIPAIEGEGTIEYTIPHLPLLPGRYQISLAVHNAADTRMFDYHDRLYTFSVNAGGTQEQYGLIRLGGQWRQINCQ